MGCQLRREWGIKTALFSIGKTKLLNTFTCVNVKLSWQSSSDGRKHLLRDQQSIIQVQIQAALTIVVNLERVLVGTSFASQIVFLDFLCFSSFFLILRQKGKKWDKKKKVCYICSKPLTDLFFCLLPNPYWKSAAP